MRHQKRVSLVKSKQRGEARLCNGHSVLRQPLFNEKRRWKEKQNKKRRTMYHSSCLTIL